MSSVDIAVEYNNKVHKESMLEELKYKGFKINHNQATNGVLTYYFIRSNTFDRDIRGMLVDDIIGAITEERLMRIKSCRKISEHMRTNFPTRDFTL